MPLLADWVGVPADGGEAVGPGVAPGVPGVLVAGAGLAGVIRAVGPGAGDDGDGAGLAGAADLAGVADLAGAGGTAATWSGPKNR